MLHGGGWEGGSPLSSSQVHIQASGPVSPVLTHLLLQRAELALGRETGNKPNEYSLLVSGKCDGDK